jgi:hypothetical protein
VFVARVIALEWNGSPNPSSQTWAWSSSGAQRSTLVRAEVSNCWNSPASIAAKPCVGSVSTRPKGGSLPGADCRRAIPSVQAASMVTLAPVRCSKEATKCSRYSSSVSPE